MSELQPSNTDAILGGQNPSPVNALVLGGGIAGAKLQIANEWGMSYELVDRLSQTHQVFSFETVKVNDIGEIIKRTKKSAFYYPENLGDEIGLDMVYIPSGRYALGLLTSKTDREENNKSVRYRKRPGPLVTMPAFYMAKYPTTQEQYQVIMAENPSEFTGIKRPVEQVEGFEIRQYCNKLEQITKKKYVLPSRRQWEYACRAGTATLFYCGDTITNDLANYDSKFRCKIQKLGINIPQTTDVDKFPPNSFGLYDLHGNVSERCRDDMFRGGSWFSWLDDCSSASGTSGFHIPSHVGFRVACLWE
jgi:formylglycine-generating enzyme required for sulfatase activity